MEDCKYYTIDCEQEKRGCETCAYYKKDLKQEVNDEYCNKTDN